MKFDKWQYIHRVVSTNYAVNHLLIVHSVLLKIYFETMMQIMLITGHSSAKEQLRLWGVCLPGMYTTRIAYVPWHIINIRSKSVNEAKHLLVTNLL